MKKSFLPSLIIIAGMAIVMFFSSCSEKDVGTKPPVIPPVVDTPVVTLPKPTGTVTAVSYSIGYNEKAKFNYAFTNADSVWCGTQLLPGTSGVYESAPLKKDTSFIFSAKGKGGFSVLPNPLTITVGQDSRIIFLTKGVFNWEYTISKPAGSDDWINSPNGAYNHYMYTWNSLLNPPGQGTFVNTVSGATLPIGWYFQGESGFSLNSFLYDQFVITDSNSFKIHYNYPMFYNNQTVNAEHWKSFRRN